MVSRSITCLGFTAVFLSVVTLQAWPDLIDTIELKNGSTVKGLILEQIPGKTVRIETLDGIELVISEEQILGFSTKREDKKRAGWASRRYLDVVTLADGVQLRGLIVEQVPGQTITLQSPYGSVFVIAIENVKILGKQAP